MKHDKPITGIILTVASELTVGVLLWIGLKIAGIAPGEHLRWFGACFVPPLLILRHYARKKEYPIVTKTIIITLFVTFIIFMFTARNEFINV